MRLFRRFASQTVGTWHLTTESLSSTRSIQTGTKGLCGYVATTGKYQWRSIEHARDSGSITTCGRCLIALAYNWMEMADQSGELEPEYAHE